MSYASLLRHTVTIERPFVTLDGLGDVQVDEYGQPERTYDTVATSPALVQARGGREAPLVSEAGVVVSDHIVFLPAGTDVRESDRLIHNGRIYEVKLVKDAAGQDHHLELDARLLVGEELTAS
jgi:head-tail adaptor